MPYPTAYAEPADLQEHYRVLFDENPVPMWLFDATTLEFLRVNRAAVAQYSYSTDEFLGMTLRDIRCESEQRRLDGVPLLGDDRIHFVTRHRRRDGSPIDVEIVSNPIPYPGRKARLAIAYDITERVRAERELRLQAQLLDVVENAVIAVNLDGHVTYWNQFAERLYGFTSAEALGRSIFELVPTGETTALAAQVFELSRAGQPWSGTIQLRRKDGSEFPAHVSLGQVRDAEGQPAGVVGISLDLTPEMEAEAHRRQSQRLEAIGQLAGGVAHDFNNLLQAISTFTELARQGIPDDSIAQQDLAEVAAAARRAADLTRQLLAFSRRQVMEPRALKLDEVVRSLEKMLRRLIGEHIAFRTECKAEPWTVHADQGQLEQVIINLAVNARDAMPQGGTLTIAVDNVSADVPIAARFGDTLLPGGYVTLTVKDTGIGMDPATLARIFDPFFTTKEPGRGTGLGLSTVYGIVKQSSGTIVVDSTPGAGSTFTVYLPRAAATAPASAPEPAPGALAHSGARVLLVEDEGMLRRATAKLLSRMGYEVLEATDGQHALALAEEHADELTAVITDTVMPNVGGAELADALRARWPRLPVVLMTGYTDAEASPFTRDDVPILLRKPFSPDELRRVLDRALAGPDSGPADARAMHGRSTARP